MTTRQAAHLELEDGVGGGNGARPRYESFVWRLRLDDDGAIHDTSIQHVGTGETGQWPAWDTSAMLEFVAARSTQPAPAPPGKPDRVPEERAVEAGRSADAPALAAVTTLRLDAPAVAAGQQLRLTLHLDFPPDGGLPYRFVYDLVVTARRLDGDLKRVVARENGTLEGGRPRITVVAGGLAAGRYRLDAALTLSKPSIGFRGRTAFVEGVMLTVWPA